MKDKEINRKIAARVRVQRYRATHRRIDYAPAPNALEVIDRLIAAGDISITGNGQG